MPVTIDGTTGIRVSNFSPDAIVTGSEGILNNRSNEKIPTTESLYQYAKYYKQDISLSGLSSTFSNIPPWFNRIKLFLRNISTTDTTTANGDILVRIGAGGNVRTDGYNSVSITYLASRSSTLGFIMQNPIGGTDAEFDFTRIPNTTLWKAKCHGKVIGTTGVRDGWGDFIDIQRGASTELSHITITTVGGTANFALGQGSATIICTSY